MTYSDLTMERMESALSAATEAMAALGHVAKTAGEDIDMALPRAKYPDVVVQLTGQDGNGFMIACRTRTAIERHLRECGDSVEDARVEGGKFFNDALSGNYDHLLATVMDWVTVE
jgi:hypothetical protein